MANIQNEAAYANAVKRNILENARKTWLSVTPRALEILNAAEAGREYTHGRVSYTDNFIGSLARSLDTFGKLSPKQSEAVLKGIDSRAARKAEWAEQQAALNAVRQHLGTVGEKITLTLTIKRIVYIDGFRGNSSYIYICEDAARNVVIYKGNAECFTYGADGNFSKQDDVLTVVATVKEHGVREGVKQTVIQRPKALSPSVSDNWEADAEWQERSRLLLDDA